MSLKSGTALIWPDFSAGGGDPVSWYDLQPAETLFFRIDSGNHLGRLFWHISREPGAGSVWDADGISAGLLLSNNGKFQDSGADAQCGQSLRIHFRLLSGSGQDHGNAG